jgi:hypothetical protein
MKIRSVGKIRSGVKAPRLTATEKANVLAYEKRKAFEAEQERKSKIVPQLDGYVVVRKLYDYDGKAKFFTFYPEEMGGNPRFFGKTEAEVVNMYKEARVFPEKFDESKEFASANKITPENGLLAVVKYKPEYYINRW